MLLSRGFREGLLSEEVSRSLHIGSVPVVHRPPTAVMLPPFPWTRRGATRNRGGRRSSGGGRSRPPRCLAGLTRPMTKQSEPSSTTPAGPALSLLSLTHGFLLLLRSSDCCRSFRRPSSSCGRLARALRGTSIHPSLRACVRPPGGTSRTLTLDASSAARSRRVRHRWIAGSSCPTCAHVSQLERLFRVPLVLGYGWRPAMVTESPLRSECDSFVCPHSSCGCLRARVLYG